MNDEPFNHMSAANLDEWLAWARTKIELSLAVSLYFQPPREAIADGILECYREFLEMTEPHLRWYANDNGTYRQATAKVLRIPFRRVPEVLGNNKYWAWVAMAGEHHRHASAYQFACNLTDDPENLSFFRAAFPVAMFAGDLRPFIALVKKFAERAPFFFGYAGFSFSESLEAATKQTNEQYLVGPAMRFSGVEVEADLATGMCCQRQIKGVNWLTLVAPQLVEQVGGKAALRAQLSDAIDFHDLKTGLLIQAGPEPGLGDVNAGERLPLTREVHRALTPIRIREHDGFGGRFFWQDETRRWMRRLDD